MRHRTGNASNSGTSGNPAARSNKASGPATVLPAARNTPRVTANPVTVEMEWPRGSGRTLEFPEIDRVEWVPLEVAQVKLLEGQTPLLARLREHLA